MTAICKTCKQTRYWRNQRGNHMPKQCGCSGEFVRAEWMPDGYRIPEKKVQPKRQRATCALCGKAGMLPGYLRVLKEPETFKVIRTKGWGVVSQLMGDDPLTHAAQAGTVVCRSHESHERNNRDPYPVFDRRNPSPARADKV